MTTIDVLMWETPDILQIKAILTNATTWMEPILITLAYSNLGSLTSQKTVLLYKNIQSRRIMLRILYTSQNRSNHTLANREESCQLCTPVTMAKVRWLRVLFLLYLTACLVSDSEEICPRWRPYPRLMTRRPAKKVGDHHYFPLSRKTIKR